MGCVAGAGGGCGLATNWGRLEMTGGGAGASSGLVKAVGVAASPGPSWVTALTGLTPGTPVTGAAGRGVPRLRGFSYMGFPCQELTKKRGPLTGLQALYMEFPCQNEVAGQVSMAIPM